VLYTPRLAHPVRRFEDVLTDAPLVVVSDAPGADTGVFFVNGSFAEIEGSRTASQE
jgi:hypothetical protein